MPHRKTDRDAVIDAALELFRTQGYHHTSVVDIAVACGLLKGSVYHYFGGKKELAMAALDRVIACCRIAAAERVVSNFGIATECGLARRPPETIPALLRQHAEVVGD